MLSLRTDEKNKRNTVTSRNTTIKKLLLNIGSLASAKVLAMAAQILILPIMARYLTPEDFGVVALAMVFVTISMTLSDAGIGASLVRTDDDDPKVWSSAFWLILGIGALFSVILILLAPWVADWFENPEIQSVLYALSPIPLLQSAIAVHLAKLQKQGEMGLITVAEITSTAVSFAAGVTTAVLGGGVWALVVQQVTLWVLKSGIIAAKAGLHIGLHFDLSVLTEHLNFGKHLVAEALVKQANNQSSNLVVGKLLGNANLGIFSMAFRFVTLPVQVVSGPVLYVLYGHMAKYKKNVSAVRTMFLAATRLVAILVIPPVAVIAAASESFFTIFLSAKWADVAPAFTLMAPASAVMAVTLLTQTVVLTRGETRLRLRLSIEMTIYWLILLPLSAQQGLNYVAAAFSLWYFSYLPRLLSAILGTINCSVKRYIKTIIAPVAYSVLFFLLHRFTVGKIEPTATQELSMLIPELLMLWGFIWIAHQKTLNRSINQLKKLTQGLKTTDSLQPTPGNA